MSVTTATPERQSGRPPGGWRIGWLRIGVELKAFFRDRESAVFNFLLPVFLLVVFGSIFGSQELSEALDITFAQYFVAGMIASGILYTSFQNLAIAIPLEREDGTLKRLRGTPMPKFAYFLGKVGLVFVAYVAQVAILIAVGALFYELRVPDTPQQWFTFGWVSVLGLLSCTFLGLAFSSVPKTGKGASAVVTPIVLALQFTSGVFIAFSQLPGWMQSIASLFPLKWLTQAMRSVFLPEAAAALEVTGSFELGRCALVLLAWTVGGAVLALLFFRWNRRGEN